MPVSKNGVIGPKVDRLETTPDMVWPSPEGRLNKLEEEAYNTVTFKDGEVTLLTQTVPDDGKATRPADPVKEGYTFDNWYSNAGLTTVYDFDTLIISDVTIYAKFIAD